MPQSTKPNRHEYEVLYDGHDHRSFFHNRILAVVIVGAGVLLALQCWGNTTLSFMPHAPQLPSHHHEVLPTLLQLRNPHDTNGMYLHALDNPTYLEYQNYHFQTSPEENVETSGPKLTLSPNVLTSLRRNTAVTLSWDTTQTNLQLNDWLLLKCRPLPDDHKTKQAAEEDDDVVVEVAKVDQIPLLTQVSPNIQSWTISSWPYLRFDACYFEWYSTRASSSWWTPLRHRFSQRPMTRSGRSNEIDLTHTHHEPFGIHWSLTNSNNNEPNQLVVQFQTTSAGTPVLQYQKTTTTSTTTTNTTRNSSWLGRTTGTSTSYTAHDMCAAPANQSDPGKFVQLSSGQLHTIVLSNNEQQQQWQPGHSYTYQVGISAGQGIDWSDSYSIVMPDFNHNNNNNLTFVVYGDQGCRDGAVETAQALGRERTAQLAHHLGDLSYANGAAHIWDEWFGMIQDHYSTWLPLMIVVGNHEYDYQDEVEQPSQLNDHDDTVRRTDSNKDPSGATRGFHPDWGNMDNDSGGECGVPTHKHFTMPLSSSSSDDRDTPASNGVFWYSYDTGLVHTLVLSSEHDMSPGSPQHAFLQHDLQSVQRHHTPWVVLELHRPLYHAEMKWDNNAVGIAMRYEIEDLLWDYQVDLVLSGHYHSYFRTCDGLYASECFVGGAPMHITIGSAGAHLDGEDLYDAPWIANFHRGVYGYGRVTVVNASDLLFEYIQTVNATTTQVLDTVWIHRDR